LVPGLWLRLSCGLEANTDHVRLLSSLFTWRRASTSLTSLDMSGFLMKAKKKAKGVVDSLRPSSRQGRSPSPVPYASGQSTPNSGANLLATLPLQQPGVTISISSPAQSGSSTPTPGPDAVQPVTSSSSPAIVTPAYARPSTPPSVLVTTGSVIHDLLTTIRDASDMCLPLKAAVVGVLKIWDVCEVRCSATDLVFRLTRIP